MIHNRCNIFPGLSYNKANCTFLNSIRNNDDESQIEFTLKVMERALVTCYCVSNKKNSLLVYLLNFSDFWRVVVVV